MAVPKASEDFHGYHAWRNSLVPLEVGTIIKWQFETLRGSTQSGDIKAGQHFVITKLRDPIAGIKNDKAPYAGKVYVLNLCSTLGKPFKREEYYSVEGIAKFLDENKFAIVGKI